jgi:CDGSH-type Zn-finger protein
MDAATTRCGGSAGLACGYHIFAAMRLMSRLCRCGLPLRGRSGDRPYRDCAYPSTVGAAAARALRGSPLQGLRVSFVGGGCRSEGALGIAPTGIARILRRWGLPRCGRSGDRPYRDCAYPSTVRGKPGGRKKLRPYRLPRMRELYITLLLSRLLFRHLCSFLH